MSIPDTDWMDNAACPGHAGLGWMKEPEEVTVAEETAMAEVCARCPVHQHCERFAARLGVTAGYWAGHFWTPDGPMLPVLMPGRPEQTARGDAA